MNEFPKRLKQLRLEDHLSQSGLAKELHTTQDSIYSWEKGRSEPSLEVICQICCYFHISADYLLGLEDESGAKKY